MKKLIKFCDFECQSDSSTLVWISLIMRDEDIQPMNEFFHETGLIPLGKNLIDWKKIDGNILGESGRSDILLIFDRSEIIINPLARLRLGSEIKWTSDFIVNFRHDYV